MIYEDRADPRSAAPIVWRNLDIDFARMMRARGGGGGLGLDFADVALQMTPIEKVAAATLLAAKLPSVNQSK